METPSQDTLKQAAESRAQRSDAYATLCLATDSDGKKIAPTTTEIIRVLSNGKEINHRVVLWQELEVTPRD